MNERRVGIVMNGVTGRMGLRQHLERSIVAIREQGGLPAADGTMIIPEPILVGRNELKLRRIAEQYGLTRWTTDLAEALAEPDVEIYFDSQLTQLREKGVRAAVEAGKAIYCEKPIAESLEAAVDLARLVRDSGLKNGVVQDKLSLPGLRKLKRLVDGGFFGRILSVRGEFGYWVFEGDWQEAQRPSWNYKPKRAAASSLDMFCHWRYVLDQIFGRGQVGLLPGRDPHPDPGRRAGPRVRRHRGRRGVRRVRAGGRHRRAAELVLGDAGVPRRAGRVPGRRHRGLARSPGCATAGPSTGPRRRSRSGTRTCRPPRSSATSGRRCRTTRCSTTGSRCSGRCSCGTWSTTRRSPGTSSRPPRACSSPSSACSRGARAASWRSRRSTSRASC